jgi:hypothetical protein
VALSREGLNSETYSRGSEPSRLKRARTKPLEELSATFTAARSVAVNDQFQPPPQWVVNVCLTAF